MPEKKFLFNDIIITPFYSPYVYWKNPSYLGYVGIKYNYCAHLKYGNIASHSVFTTRSSGSYENPSIYFGILYSSYGHFLLETMSRLYLARDLSKDYSLIFSAHCFQDAYLLKFQDELFELYGLNSNPKFTIKRPTLFKQIYIAPPGLSLNFHITAKQLDALGIICPRPVAGNKIYLSRSKITKGKCLNEIDIEKLLIERGWQIIHLEELSVNKQIQMLATAETIFGISGSAFHSLLMLKGRISQRIVVIPRIHDRIYNAISDAKCDNYYLLNNLVKEINYKEDKSKMEFEVNIGTLRNILDKTKDFSDISDSSPNFTRPAKPSSGIYACPSILHANKTKSLVADNLFYKIIESFYQGHSPHNSLKILSILITKKMLKEYMVFICQQFLDKFYKHLSICFNNYCEMTFNSKEQAAALQYFNEFISKLPSALDKKFNLPQNSKSLAPLLPPHQYSLNDIGRRQGTDKSWHRYLDFYEQHFGIFRDKRFSLVEVGVFKGDSIAMWEDYFKNADIYGIDIKNINRIFQRAKIIQGNATDSNFLSPFLLQVQPLIFIDDGSHIWSHQIKTFELAFPHVVKGGYYICEDVQVCFGDYRNSGYADHPVDSVTFFSQLALLVNNDANTGKHPYLNYVEKNHIKLAESIEYITFKRHCVLIRKNNQDFPL